MNYRNDEFKLLGLKPSEKKIVVAVSKMGKTVSQISRHTGIPRTSILYILKGLADKKYVRLLEIGKGKFWRSNIPKILTYIKNRAKPFEINVPGSDTEELFS